jgi:hypothetical protein
MARSSDFPTSNDNIVFWIEAIQNSQNVTNNTSSVTVRLWIRRTNSGYTTYGSGTSYLTINGTQYSEAITTADKITSTSLKLMEKTVTVAHNSDGTKTLAMAADINHDTFTAASHSWSMTLTTIPRTSQMTLSASSVAYGSAVTINTNRASTSFTHTVRATWNGVTETIATGVQASWAWTVPNSYMSRIPSATSTVGTLYLDTYSGSTKIGTDSVNLTTTVPSTIVPTFTAVTASENVSDVASKIGSYVQGLSKLNMAITGAAGAYGSTISKYELTFEGVTKTGSSVVSDLIKGSGTLTITGKITDSRGRTASKTLNVTVLAYTPPKITAFTVQRANVDGTLNDMGTYAKVTRAGTWNSLNSKNTLSVVIKSKARGTSTWTTKSTVAAGTTGSYNNAVTIGTYSEILSHDFQVEFIDLFNTTISIAVLSTGLVTMSWGKSGIGIGKVWEKGGLDLNGDLNVKGNANITGSGSGVGNLSLVQFYESDGVTRKGYSGDASSSNNDIYLGADNGATVLRPNLGHPARVENGEFLTDVNFGYGSHRIPANADLNNYTKNGFYYCPANADAVTIANTATNAAFSLFVEQHAGTKQTFTEYYNADYFRVFQRNKYSTTWGPWIEVSMLHSWGSNVNGRYVRYTNGIMQCSVNGATNMSISSAYGSLYQNSVRWTYPATFVGDPAVAVGKALWGTGASWATVAAHTNTYADIRAIDAFNRASGSLEFSAIAMGVWK